MNSSSIAELLQQQGLLGILGEIGVHRPARGVQRHHEHSEAQGTSPFCTDGLAAGFWANSEWRIAMRGLGSIRYSPSIHGIRLHRLGVEAEHPGGVAAEDVAAAGVAQERQVVDHARQVEVPVRVVRRPHQLGLGIDHLEGRFQDRAVARLLHRLRGVIHLAHVLARLALERGAIRGAHHVGVVEPLHQAIGPGQPALDPHHLELGEALGQAVDHPIGHVDHVEPHEAERVHRDEAVGQRQRLVVPIVGGMEGDRLAHLLEQRIGLDVGVVVHRLVARRRHHEADHALLVAEILHRLVGGFRIVERQIQHRDDAGLDREDALAEPAIVGAAHRHLDLDLRMQAEKQHRRREQAGIIDAHGVHPFERHADVAVLEPAELVVSLDVVPAQVMARDAPTDVLISDRAAEHRGALAALG